MVQPIGRPGPVVSAMAAQYWQTGGRAPLSRSFCRPMRQLCPRARSAASRPLLVGLGRGEEGEQLVAVAVQLAGADALDRQQLAPAAGLPRRLCPQRAAVVDPGGWVAGGLGGRAAGCQRLVSQCTSSPGVAPG